MFDLSSYPTIIQCPGALVLPRSREPLGVDILSRYTVAGTPAGLWMAWHAGDPDTAVRAPSSAGEVTTTGMGVAVFDPWTTVPYAAGAMVPMLRRGALLVAVEEAVTPASPVFVRYAAGVGGTVLGAFRASADTATAAQVARAKYLTTQPIPGGLVQLSLSL